MTRNVLPLQLLPSLLFCLVITIWEAPVAAAEGVQVAAVWGELRLERDREIDLVRPGADLRPGDRLLTGSGDRAKVVVGRVGILDLAPGSEVALLSTGDGVGAAAGQGRMELLRGKVRIRWLASAPESARLRLETPTAAVVGGEDFIASYDEARTQSDIVGLRDGIEVVGRLAVVGGSVILGVRESTSVRRGQFPVPAERVDEARYQDALQGFTIVGTGGSDGLAAGHPATTGRLLSPRDLPEAVPAEAEVGRGIVLGAPPAFLADEMSPDLRVHDEPLLDYLRQQPGLPLPPSTGGIVVEF